MAVNRYWAQLFGTGIVETEEDFGTQGELPSHPALLDWLAVRYMDSGWDTKAMIKLIVTSATYRQSSRVTPELLRRDPRNRLLARAPRVRLEAEMVRDQALALSGLLSPKIGGPSVFPPQPDRPLAGGLQRPADVGHQPGHGQVSPGPLHLLAAHRAVSVDGHVRRAQPRDLRDQAGADQHAAPGVRDPERSGLRRGRPGAGPADCSRGRLESRGSRRAMPFSFAFAGRRGPSRSSS